MDKLVKENIIYLVLVALAFVGGVYLIYSQAGLAVESWGQVITSKETLKTHQEELSKIKEAKEEEEKRIEAGKKKETDSGKQIYEVQGQQFSAEASFGILFEGLLTNITDSGLRIRSIDYNYNPADDKILMTNAPGYNACELSFLAVGTYSQYQNFFKSIAKGQYLNGIDEIYIEPYDRDKSILISRFKIKLYTRTI
ncbi:hypothetical protein IJ670_05180 [bacterium]|nr:hypothetical protein [bacterium]